MNIENFFMEPRDVVIDRRILNAGLWVAAILFCVALRTLVDSFSEKKEVVENSGFLLLAGSILAVFVFAKLDFQENQLQRAGQLVAAQR